ncbi:MAG: hypothetical protein KME46_19175 [Brasilonema angustatum HA4187-MV1]|nr:hypothetical protein [Brasilonema angustatum HA4187-MV1]
MPNSKNYARAAYRHLGKAHDATFELTDAILLTCNAYSLADLSLSPVFRRKWLSIYVRVRAACPLGTQRYKIADHSICLMQLYIKQMLTVGRPSTCSLIAVL